MQIILLTLGYILFGFVIACIITGAVLLIRDALQNWNSPSPEAPTFDNLEEFRHGR